MAEQAKLSPQELLDFLGETGKINIERLQQEATMKKKEEYVAEVLNRENRKLTLCKDNRWRVRIPIDGKMTVIAKTRREDMIEFLYELFCEPERKVTLSDMYPEWIKLKELQTSRDTYIKRIKTDWSRFYQDDPLTATPIEELTSIQCEKWLLEKIKDNKLTKTAYYNMSLIIREVLDFAVRNGVISVNPARQFKVNSSLFRPVSKKADSEQVFSDMEVEKIEEMAWNDFQEAGRKVYRMAPLAALFAFYTGARVGEITGFKWRDIEVNDITVNRFVERESHDIVEHAKSAAGTGRKIPLTKPALRIISACKAFPHAEDWIFSEYSRPLPSRVVEKYFSKYCKALNTPQKSTHCARKTYISSLIDAGVNINTVRKAAGHADERTTYHNYVYDRSTPEEKRQKFESAMIYKADRQPAAGE